MNYTATEAGYIGKSTQDAAATKPENGFERLETAKKHLYEAQGRVGRLADRLAGEAAEGKGEPGIIGGAGLLGTIETSAHDLTQIAQKIMADVSRIESRL